MRNRAIINSVGVVFNMSWHWHHENKVRVGYSPRHPCDPVIFVTLERSSGDHKWKAVASSANCPQSELVTINIHLASLPISVHQENM